MPDLFEVFGGAIKVQKYDLVDPELQFRQAIEKAGLKPPDEVLLDGEVHRFNSDDKGGKTGWYIGFGDDIPGGAFGCWRKDIREDWRASIGRELTSEELKRSKAAIEKAKAKRRQQLEQQRESTRIEVARIWEQGQAASDGHAYLKRKRVKAHGARIADDGRLMIPLYNAKHQLCSLQYIDGNGGKLYHPGGKVGGAYLALGMPSDTIYVAEGFATGATIREVTDQMTYVAFSASNLPAVTGIIREAFGKSQRIVIVADNDEGGIGYAKAHEAAAKYAAHVVMPPELGDANDFHNSGQDLAAVLSPEVGDWLTEFDSWTEQPAPLRWLVKNWIQERALMMVHGPSGGGKTFVVLDWALRIAAGLPDWRGHKVKAGAVVYLAGEGHHGIRGRGAAWKYKHGVSKTEMWMSKTGCDLNTEIGYQRTAEAIRALPASPKLIIVDTLHRFLLGDENSAQDAKTMLDACANLMSEFDCSVLLVHHTGVSDEAQHRARGSSAWRGALDIEVSIVPAKGDKPIEIIQRKSKDAELAQSLQASLETVAIPGWFDEDGAPVTSAIITAAEFTPTDDKIAFRKDRFARAWLDSDCPRDSDSRPWVGSRQLKTWLIETEKLKAATAESELKPSKSGRLIASLLDQSLIEPNVYGWSVCDDSWASALNMMRKARG